MPARNARPLWRCPQYRRRFANRNQTHTCGLHDLAHHFAGKPPLIRAIYNAVVKRIRGCGPVLVLPEKTRIAFQVRMSFAQVTPRRQWLDGHVVLARRLEHPRFRRVETFSLRNHVHHFRLRALADVDDVFEAWVREAYAVGQQRHLARAGGQLTVRMIQSAIMQGLPSRRPVSGTARWLLAPAAPRRSWKCGAGCRRTRPEDARSFRPRCPPSRSPPVPSSRSCRSGRSLSPTKLRP